MKLKPLIILVIVSLVCAFTFIRLSVTSPNNQENKVKCDILKAYQTNSVSENSSETKYTLILRDPKGRMFDVNVSLKTFYIASTSKEMSFMLSENDITDKCSKKEKTYELLGVISLFILIGSGIFSMVSYIDD